jgi:hypothetical protein
MKKKKERKIAQKKSIVQEEPREVGIPWFRLSNRTETVLYLAFLVLVTLIYFAPMVFEGKSPTGEDVIGSKGKTHQISEVRKQIGRRALWNPYVFSGMPVYHRWSGEAKSMDTLIGRLTNTSGRNGVAYFLVGAIGMFLLLKHVGLQSFSALVGALCFLFMPHWQGILQAGHFAKFRPIMMMPWVLLTFLYLLNRRNLLSGLCFILVFSLQLRTQHYQIIFYTGILLFFVGVNYGIGWLREKEYLRIVKSVTMIFVAVGVVFMMVAQPLRVTKEYTPYSIRGGTGEQGSTGLDVDYATRWSFAPREVFSLLMPRFFGGTSGERYTGDAVPAFKGKRIPGYWGDAPFTGSTDYLGVVAVILAAIGICAYRKIGLVLTLALLMVFSLLLSFGRHFPAFYGIFFEYMPAFNKFRVPSMILVLIMFSISIIAAYALNSLMQAEKSRTRELQIITLWICGFLLIIGLVPFLFKGAFSFEKPGEAEQYGRTLEYLRAARYDMMKTDAIRLMLFAVGTCGLIWGYLRRFWPQKSVLAAGIIALALIDFISVGNRFLDKDHLANTQELERTYFAKTDADRFLLNDQEHFRIFPVGELFNTNNWSYYHQSISGYDPAKLRVTQDVIESCLYKGWNPRLPINWNVVNMLNVKYLIAKGTLPDSHLQLVYTDKREQYLIYRNLGMLPRAFFVGDVEVIPEKKDRLARLNDPRFDPGKTAILEFDPTIQITAPDSSASAKVVLFEPDRIVVEAQNQHSGLMVLSEIYYPKGWRATVDGNETKIFKTSHILRSVWVPGGKHKIEFSFHPATYFRNARISRYATWMVYLLLLVELGRRFGPTRGRRFLRAFTSKGRRNDPETS